MNLKKIGIGLLTLGTVFSLGIGGVSAANRTLTLPLSASLNGASASLDTTCSYNENGDGFNNYGYSNYNVNFTNTYGITMTKASWSTPSTSTHYKKVFTWNSKSYLLSDNYKNAVKSTSKRATYSYEKSTGKYTVESDTLY